MLLATYPVTTGLEFSVVTIRTTDPYHDSYDITRFPRSDIDRLSEAAWLFKCLTSSTKLGLSEDLANFSIIYFKISNQILLKLYYNNNYYCGHSSTVT